MIHKINTKSKDDKKNIQTGRKSNISNEIKGKYLIQFLILFIRSI